MAVHASLLVSVALSAGNTFIRLRQASYSAPRTHLANSAEHHSRRPTTIDMAAAQDQKPATKKFGKGERTVPHSSQKASKYYPAEDNSAPKKVCRHPP